jgi:fluoride exporter
VSSARRASCRACCSDGLADILRYQIELAIFAGGVIGALARAGLDRWFVFGGYGLPWATFVANVAGTAALGYFATRLQERLPPSTFRRPLLGTGFCGALTTFSTFQIEVISLIHRGHVALALAYLLATVVVGLVTVQAAIAQTRRARLR